MVVLQDLIKSNPYIMPELAQDKLTFTQALRDKYIDQEEFDNYLVVPKDKMISTEITYVGFGKISCIQKQLRRLVSIDLSGRNIKLVGSFQELNGSLNRVQILNLANNHLTWDGVAEILSCLPNLKELILTNNPLTEKFETETQSVSIKPLLSLTLGCTMICWSSIVEVLSTIWPSVEQLDLWNSKLTIESMTIKSSLNRDMFLKEIKVLKLSHNSFDNLNWINHAGPLYNLTELDLSNCRLKSIDLDCAAVDKLQNLRVLNLSYNNLDQWTSISNLNALNNLKSLMCHENPIFITEKFAKALAVGRLGKIKILNREEISHSFRRDAEILYLRRTFPDYLAYKNGERANFPVEHPRYDELINLYGIPEDLMKKEVIDKYISVDLCLEDKIITKKLPSDMRVANLRMLSKKLFKLKPSCTIQIICDGRSSDGNLSYPLDKDGQTLDFFSVKTGQKIIIKKVSN